MGNTVTDSELAELRRDAERLEWMIESESRCYPLAVGGYAVIDHLEEMSRGSTPREAIDRARGVK